MKHYVTILLTLACLCIALLSTSVSAEDVYLTAEDGLGLILYFDETETGLEYSGCEHSLMIHDYPDTFPDAYISDGYFSDPDSIALEENQVLVTVDYCSDFPPMNIGEYKNAVTMSGRKFYILTVDGENSSVRYAGHSEDKIECEAEETDGTEIPPTGNGSCIPAVLISSAVMIISNKLRKKEK